MDKDNYRGISMAFYDDFKCTGNKCIDNCCGASNWSINVDQESMEKYKNLEESLKKDILDTIKFENDVYKMKSREDGYCLNLAENGLCNIHKALGEDYLSQTCKSYPRMEITFNNSLEFGLTLSCPVVAEHILFMKDGIYFEVRETFRKIELDDQNNINLEAEKYKISEHVSFNIKMLSINILKNRNYPLSQRLAYFGMMVKNIDKISNIENQQYKIKENEIMKTLIMYEKNINDEIIYNQLTKLRDKKYENEKNINNYLYPNMLTLLKILMGKLDFDNQKINKDFYEKIKNVSDVEKNFNEIINMKNTVLKKYLNENEYVFENYLVWDLFYDNFPFKYDSLDVAYKSFILKYILLQLFISSVYKDSKTLKHTEIINCVYYFCRHFNHSLTIKDDFKKIIEYYKFLDLASLLFVL